MIIPQRRKKLKFTNVKNEDESSSSSSSSVEDQIEQHDVLVQE